MLFLDCLPLGIRYLKKIKENHTNGRPWRNLSILYICRSSDTNYGRLLCIYTTYTQMVQTQTTTTYVEYYLHWTTARLYPVDIFFKLQIPMLFLSRRFFFWRAN